MDPRPEQLEAIRHRLDALDDRLVALINERAELARLVGTAKAQAGMRVYAPDREREVLSRICTRNEGPLDDATLRSIYRELMSASLKLERSPRIAILGPPGSYSHVAGRRKFGMSVEFEALPTISAVFDEVQRGHAEYGLVPIENAIAGGIGETIDALIEREAHVCGELMLAVHHHLLGTGPLEAVREVCSKPEVFHQCEKWLASTGFASKVAAVGSTSAAAERARSDPGVAAIASDLAAELYGLNVLAEHVEDDAGNTTRFLIIGDAPLRPTGSDKTSIAFGTGHRAGTLAEVLDVFRTRRINMTRIESRPNRRKRWEHYFLVDFEGHADTPGVRAALEEMSARSSFWKVLGSYPAANEVV